MAQSPEWNESNVHHQYRHSPLVEAVVDIQVAAEQPVDLAVLERICRSHEERYPTRRNVMIGRLEVRSEPASLASNVQHRLQGYAGVTEDGLQLYQVKTGGFTFNRLSPYTSWQAVREEARRLWTSYHEAVHPLTLTRIATKYVNRFDLPLPLSDFTDYLNTVPTIAPGLPQSLSGYLMQLQIPVDRAGVTLLLTETIVPPPGPKLVSVLLDLDAFHIESEPLTDSGLWESLDRLHELVYSAFESCMTDKLRELID